MAEIEVIPGLALSTVRALKLDATQRLLGATIAVPDEDWQQASLLPGWTRAHVATHLARNADGMVRLARNAVQGTADPMYPGDRDEEIERGSERTALELQVDLDQSAGQLNRAFDDVDDAGRWEAEVEMRGGSRVPAKILPLARLFEVELHHIDMAIGRTCDDLDDDLALLLLEQAAVRARGRGGLDARLVPTVGAPVEIGRPTTTVTGTPQGLLAWLTGRPSRTAVDGAASLTPPAL